MLLWSQGDLNKEAFFLYRQLFSLKMDLPVEGLQCEGKHTAVVQGLYVI